MKYLPLPFLKDDRGGTTVEFVAIMPAFMLVAFVVMEFTIALFWIATAEKAVQAGVRLAIVSDWAVTTHPDTNAKTTPTGVYGKECLGNDASESTNCQTWEEAGYEDPISCTGGTDVECDATAFNRIRDRIQAVFPFVSQADIGQYITVTYSDSRLGYAGGPVIPRVTVSLSGVPYGLVVSKLVGNLVGDDTFMTTMPTISTTMTGEDLSTPGA